MKTEIIRPNRGTSLRSNGSNQLKITIPRNAFGSILLINGNSFITEILDENENDLTIPSYSNYMLINKGPNLLEISYSEDISDHNILYDPYKFENSKKEKFEADFFLKRYNIPKDYVNTLPKWYSFKFIYPDYNLIFIKPELGLSIQNHNLRKEFWEILEGEPIVINGKELHYAVKKGNKFINDFNIYHSIINPNKDSDRFVLIKEHWKGLFDEKDIERIFNPNKYFSQ